MTFDAKAFVQAGYEVVPSANGGIILAGEGQNLAFTAPDDFVEWLRDVYGLKSQEDLMEPYLASVGAQPVHTSASAANLALADLLSVGSRAKRKQGAE